MSILSLIVHLEHEGYPAANILAVVRAELESADRRRDTEATEQEAESRRRLAALASYGETNDPFAA